MSFPTFFRQAILAGLCSTGLVAAPEDHQATVVNRTRTKWELWLGAEGQGTLRVTRKSNMGVSTTLEYPPGEPSLISLRPQEEITLSFTESKGQRSRSATLGEIGALEETRSGLYLQGGPHGFILAATGQGPFEQKGNRLVIKAPAGPSCAIL